METIFCKHFRSMSQHKTCEAGVSYESLREACPTFDDRPCFAEWGDETPKPGCDLVQLPTRAEQEEKRAWFRKRAENIGLARQAIVAACGGKWKKGMPSVNGAIDCPVCSQSQSLSYSRSGYNGHIHAKCKTDKCVGWME